MGKVGLQEIDKECYSMYAIVEASPVRILVLNILVYPPARSLEYKNIQLVPIHSACKYMAFYSLQLLYRIASKKTDPIPIPPVLSLFTAACRTDAVREEKARSSRKQTDQRQEYTLRDPGDSLQLCSD